ncbi:MAG: FHA-domain-containing protein [uncultured Frankineae bacterium]|uniref:FHA-domain-containing protein n=1 Tax=uncultured Frankineae bacterium TaxID=437475 RepID=A0A6J4LA60_9ACTN|nr:MAG: FHA-domain-containing protein [uncultured Frankineae bacterium]
MGSALVVAAVKFGLLALLWLFVVIAFRTVRSDLYGTGARTPAAARPVAAAAAPRSPAAPPGPGGRRGRSAARRLVVTEGALAGTTIGLGDGPVTLGRADDSTLVLTDDYASSRHARLVPGDGAWLVEDLGSTNGTYLGAAKVVRPTPVPLGQQIRIGKTVLELRR